VRRRLPRAARSRLARGRWLRERSLECARSRARPQGAIECTYKEVGGTGPVARAAEAGIVPKEARQSEQRGKRGSGEGNGGGEEGEGEGKHRKQGVSRRGNWDRVYAKHACHAH